MANDDLWGSLGYQSPTDTSSPDLRQLVSSKAAQYGIPADIADRWVQAESGYNPKAKSPKGAMGLTQLMPKTAQTYGVQDVQDPAQNVEAGAHYLADLKQQFGSWDKALAAYNAGPDAVTKAGGVPNIAETQAYVQKILGDHSPDNGSDLWGALGYKTPTAGAEGEPAFDAAHPKMVGPSELSPVDLKTYTTLLKGGKLDADKPYGDESNPFFNTDPKQVPPGAYFVQAGKLQRAPGGPKESSLAAGLGQGVADVATSMSHLAPGTDDSDVKNALLANEMTYGAKYGGDLKSGTGRFTGQMAATVPLMLTGEGAAAPVLSKLGPVGEFLMGKGAQSLSPGMLKLLGRGASLAAKGAQEGAGAAGLTSASDNAPVGEQMAQGAIGGALLGPVAPAITAAGRGVGRFAKAVAAPLTGEGQEGIVEKTLGNFATGPLAPDLSVKVPGSEPTLAEGAGDAGVSLLQKKVSEDPRVAQQFAERTQQNNQARKEFYQSLAGDADHIAALEQARDAATAGQRDAILASQTKPADVKPVLDTIDTILKGPEGKRAAVRDALGEVRSNLMDADGNPETQADMLYGVRKGIGDLLGAKATSPKADAKLASAELKSVQGALDKAIEDAAPGFKDYLANYSELSKPINEARFLQSQNIGTVDGVPTFASVQRLINKIDTMRNQSGTNDAKSISPETYQKLLDLRDDLDRARNIDLGKARGSNTDQNLVTGNIAESTGLPAAALAAISHHPKVAAVLAGGKLVLGSKEKEVMSRMANRLLYPNSAPVAQVAKPQNGMAARLTAPIVPSAAGIIANQLTAPR